MKLSKFGKKLTAGSGIVELMEDLGSALNENPEMIFMGGGNPARIPEIEALFKQRLESIANDSRLLSSMTGVYQSPQGELGFRRQMADLLSNQFGWSVSASNIAVSNGSQSAFFTLYNLLAGEMPDGTNSAIHLPLTPEYIGYSDIGISDPFFTATKPDIELMEDGLFKYRVDFSSLEISDKTAALCVSRPTNPTGNVLTDSEIQHLDQIATNANIPLIIDGAYGLPFPNITFADVTPHWNNNTILVLSLSKLGLPGVRTGIIVANKEVIQAYTQANTIINLACGNLGPAMVGALFASGEIITVSREVVKPFYQKRASQTLSLIKKYMGNTPYLVHRPEGAIFLWLWFEDLPITSAELYQRLKNRGVLVVPGHNFFPGIKDDWKHRHECIRLSYAQDRSVVERGIKLMAEEVSRAYAEG